MESKKYIRSIGDVEERVQGEANGLPMSCQEPGEENEKGEECGVPVRITSLEEGVVERTR